MAGKKKGGLGRGLEYLFADGLLTQPASVIDPDGSAGVSIATLPEDPAAGTDPANAAEPVGKAAPAQKKTAPAETRKRSNSKASGDPVSTASGESVLYISLNDIKPNASQPRKNFDQESLQELADSIKAYGVIQPVLLRPAKKGYELVAGERRWRAARLAGLKTVPAIVRDLDERQNAFYALIENMQREDLDPIEEAEGIQEIIGNYGLTQEEASKVVGRSRSYVTNSLRMLSLPQAVKELVQSKQLSAGHARAIAGLAGEALQLAAAQKAVKEGWSVRQIERFTQTQEGRQKRRKPERSRLKSADVLAVEEELAQALGTKVAINGSEKRGKIEIEYFSRDELDRLIDLLRG